MLPLFMVPLLLDYNHKCSKCNANSEIIARDNIDYDYTLKCPNCKNALKLTSIGMWD